MNSSKNLACAIFVNALKDAQEGSQEAREWLLKDKSSFPFWCRTYGISPTLARRELEKAIKTAPVTKKRRKELITQTLRESPELSNREIGRRLGCNYAAVRQVRLRMVGASGNSPVPGLTILGPRRGFDGCTGTPC